MVAVLLLSLPLWVLLRVSCYRRVNISGWSKGLFSPTSVVYIFFIYFYGLVIFFRLLLYFIWDAQMLSLVKPTRSESMLRLV